MNHRAMTWSIWMRGMSTNLVSVVIGSGSTFVSSNISGVFFENASRFDVFTKMLGTNWSTWLDSSRDSHGKNLVDRKVF